MDFLNFGIILALVPIIQATVQGLKRDSWSTWTTRVFALVISLLITFVVRQSGIPEISESLFNNWFAGLTALVAWLMAMGLYSQTRTDVANKIAKSESNVTVPSEVVDATKEDAVSTPSI